MHEPLVRSHARRLLERATEMANGKLQFLSEHPERDIAVKVGRQNVRGSTFLPGRKSPPYWARWTLHAAVCLSDVHSNCKRYMVDEQAACILRSLQRSLQADRQVPKNWIFDTGARLIVEICDPLSSRFVSDDVW